LVLRPYYKKLIFILLFWSFIVAYSRIYIGVHYPLDIFFGMIYGALSGVLFYHLNKYLLKRFIDVKT
ncbi:MAG: phosphatase PAP2 family protein, partial [Winogradskyella sp.]|nr:phosphatase PAP2 family protein [Winogradskyella sp.]